MHQGNGYVSFATSRLMRCSKIGEVERGFNFLGNHLMAKSARCLTTTARYGSPSPDRVIQRYWRVAWIVNTDVPELVGLLPVA
jgi:hypothetical protein